MPELKLNTIYNEDCFLTIQRIKDSEIRPHIVLTSPPYNQKCHHIAGKKMYDTFNESDVSDYIQFTVDLFNALDGILSQDGVILYNLSYNQTYETFYKVLYNIIDQTPFTIPDKITWKKPFCIPVNTSPNKLSRLTEDVFVIARKTEVQTYKTSKKFLYKEQQNKFTCLFNYIEAKNNDGSTDLNKATFSTELVLGLLEMFGFSKDIVVYDPFMGTGTTANGCVEFGCSYIGSEISPEQCQYAESRVLKTLNLKKNSLESNLW